MTRECPRHVGVMHATCRGHDGGNATGMSWAMTGECHGHECGRNVD